MTIKAIVFDMDGVLFETEHFYYQRRKEFLERKGITIDHIPPTVFVGGRVEQVWELVLGTDIHKWDVPALAQEYHAYKEAHPAPYPDLIFPDTNAVLAELHAAGFRLALASNTDRVDIKRALGKAELLPYFEHVLSAMECGRPKPNPAVYERAAQALDIPKEQILVVEDSQKGIAAGKAAGLTVWGIRDQLYGVNQEQADRLVDSLIQLAKDIRKINSSK